MGQNFGIVLLKQVIGFFNDINRICNLILFNDSLVEWGIEGYFC